ncbi:MAG: 2-amino-4-hydroxy-6-hydroxymethyldihydropteridine diphosphokinase [Crocinitomicaceae bacterium]
MESKRCSVILSFGSNLGDSKGLISCAYERLENAGLELLQKSSFYSSPPWGFEAENDFVNTVAIFKTELKVEDLLELAKFIEKELGREESDGVTYASRTIDIDIIDYNGRVYESETLSIPHASCHLRAFVLVPLQEIHPNWIHPKLKKGIDQIIQDFQVVLNTVKI